MSREIIETLQLGNSLCAIFIYGIITFFILFVIYMIVDIKLAKKKNSLESEKLEEDKSYQKEMRELNTPLATESTELVEQIEQLEEEHDSKSKELKKSIDKCTNLSSTLEKIYEFAKPIITIAFILLFMAIFIIIDITSGEVSCIKPIESEQTGVQAVAYYVTDYANYDQDTLTVVVKNNTNKVVNDAILEETNSGETTIIEGLAPGQEKLVSITIYSTEDEAYNFEFKGINFKE